MSGVNFIDNVLAPDGGVDSVVERKYPGGSNKTTIGNYWPLIDYNPGSGNVQQFAYNSTIQPAWTLPGPLGASGAVAGSPDTKVLVLPVTLNYSAVFPFARVVYHRSDGQLGEFIRDAGSGEVLAPTGKTFHSATPTAYPMTPSPKSSLAPRKPLWLMWRNS